MPRNPNKKICAKAKCRSYAMRGRDLCRSHLDPVLGPRGAGPPKGNINAMLTGETAKFDRLALQKLAQQIVEDPDIYHRHLLHYLEQSGRPTADPLRSLLLLRNQLERLLPFVAEILFTIEADELINRFPPSAHASVQVLIWQGMLHLQPLQRIVQFRKMRQELHIKSEARRRLEESQHPIPPTNE